MRNYKCAHNVLVYLHSIFIHSLFQIHWLAVNGRAEVLQDIFAYIKDVDIEVRFLICEMFILFLVVDDVYEEILCIYYRIPLYKCFYNQCL